MRSSVKLAARPLLGAFLIAAAAGALIFFLPRPPLAAYTGPLAGRPPAPELDGGTRWLNSSPLTMRGLRGKVVLIDFWEYTCVNCIRTVPYLREWHARYRDKGLVIVGVHTPEFHFARSERNVASAVKQLRLEYPIVLDSDYAIWKAYGNRFWPAKYLVDAQGAVRYYHFGEGGYGATEQEIQSLLREIDPHARLPALMEPVRAEDHPGRVCYPSTPELYAGYERGSAQGTLGNREGYRPDRAHSYRDPGRHLDGLIYLHGLWRSSAEALVSAQRNPYPAAWIALRYHALEVNSVMRPEGTSPVRVWVYQDGKPVPPTDRGSDLLFDERGRSFARVDEPRMYNLIRNAAFGEHELRIATSRPNLGVYSFTFVSCEMTESR
jgi:thiol-disulfide isomerase/thioredoxin